MALQRKWDGERGAPVHYLAPAQFPARLKLLRWLGRQTWLPKGQDRLLRLVRHPERGDHFFFEVDFFGQKYRGDLGHYIDWTVFCYGAAPYSEVSLLRDISVHIRRVRGGRLSFFDVGANAGHHTLFMAPLADRVIAFEPLPELVRLIEERIELNHLTNVRIVPVALGERNETLTYYPGEGANSGVGTFVAPDDAAERRRIELVVRRGDELSAEMGLPEIDLLKVDVEGFEPFVFRGLAERIGRDRPVILTEVSDASRRGFGSEADFRRCFYDGACFAQVTGRPGRPFRLRPFSYATCNEALIVPPELATFVTDRL